MTQIRNVLLALGATLLLAGCGGGGGGTVAGVPGGGGSPGGRSPAITGTVGVTTGTATALGFGRAAADGVEPILAATVELHIVDPNNPLADDPNHVDFTTTDGTYTFYSDQVILGAEYRLEAHGQVNGSNVSFETFASSPAATSWSTPLNVNVTEATTVASRLVVQQMLDLARDGISLDEMGDLQEQIARYAEAFADENLATPDFSDPAWPDALSDELDGAVAPTGSFVGTYSENGAQAGWLGALVAPNYDDPNGPMQFLIFALPNEAQAITQSVSPQPPVIADDEDPELLTGTVSPGGYVYAESDDGNLVVTGSLIGPNGSGTWTYTNPTTSLTQTGPWSIRQIQAPFGPYGGCIFDEDGGEGRFAALYLDDGATFVRAEFDSPGGYTWVNGVGTVGAGGSLAFNWFDSTGRRGTGEGVFEAIGDVSTVFGSLFDQDGNTIWTFDGSTDNPFPNGLP